MFFGQKIISRKNKAKNHIPFQKNTKKYGKIFIRVTLMEQGIFQVRVIGNQEIVK